MILLVHPYYFNCCANFELQLIETELNRKIKREPPLGLDDNVEVFVTRTKFNQESEDTMQVDVVSELWAFG